MLPLNFKPSKLLLAALCVPFAANATDYYIGSDVSNTPTGQSITYQSHKFTTGTTAFSAYALIAGRIADGDNIFFAPGVVDGFTITNNNIGLYGAGAFHHPLHGERPDAETEVTGPITLQAGISGVKINGFAFTGQGQVVNTTATRNSAPVSNITFSYNRSYTSTLTRTQAVLYLGDAWRPNRNLDPSDPSASARYRDITVEHNSFEGIIADNQPMPVQIAGSAGVTAIVDNSFVYGGTSVSLFNTIDNINIAHNTFRGVGKEARATGNAFGEFCIRLFYIGVNQNEPATAEIQYNVFDGCQGQSGMYSLIRFYGGDTNEAIYKPWANLTISHNLFRNKQTPRDDGYNYVFYANKGTCTDNSTVDWRFNHYDQSELQLAWVRPQWEASPGRYYGGSSELFDHTTSDDETTGTGTLIDYVGATTDGKDFYKATPKDTSLKSWKFGTTTVVQSSDVDDVTGDWYFIQVMGSKFVTTHGGPYVGLSPVMVTRISKDGTTSKSEQMYLDCAGHGSNMAVCNIDGVCYMFIGGCSSASSTSPTKICILPFVAGATVDVRNDSFTYGGNTYPIKHFKNSYTYSMPYPSIDRDNQLFVERSRSSAGDYFTVYNLMDVFLTPESAKPLKQTFVPANSLPIRSSSREFLNINDRGFKTWSDQGFTIGGDYIYSYEGNGDEGYQDTPNPTNTAIGGDNKPIQIINAINWRTGEFIYRKAILKTKVYADVVGTNQKMGPFSLSSGEPESIKIHRDATGRPNLMIGVVEGASGARLYNMFAYRQRRQGGQGYVYTYDNPSRVITPVQTSVNFTSTGNTAQSTLDVQKTSDIRQVHAAVTGPDADCFTVTPVAQEHLTDQHQFLVSFTPRNNQKDYSASLRLTSLDAEPQTIALTATHQGFTGIEKLPVLPNTLEDPNNPGKINPSLLNPFNPEAKEFNGCTYYNLAGQKVNYTKGLPLIVVLPNGLSGCISH